MLESKQREPHDNTATEKTVYNLPSEDNTSGVNVL